MLKLKRILKLSSKSKKKLMARKERLIKICRSQKMDNKMSNKSLIKIRRARSRNQVIRRRL